MSLSIRSLLFDLRSYDTGGVSLAAICVRRSGSSVEILQLYFVGRWSARERGLRPTFMCLFKSRTPVETSTFILTRIGQPRDSPDKTLVCSCPNSCLGQIEITRRIYYKEA
ncbi:hypothetical protein N7495_002680 [Penicillium taxi]|uniref:uncharacterized protein n=1 Tax=Penicillium taxi TaxID=168475 RepID=UPI002545A220|nr:uncharacterized protein N7495_002680 [Penicillium taxi]KAJ5902152.1 hypothetical protein N7495_002680 [Penicillium taxi]